MNRSIKPGQYLCPSPCRVFQSLFGFVHLLCIEACQLVMNRLEICTHNTQAYLCTVAANYFEHRFKHGHSIWQHILLVTWQLTGFQIIFFASCSVNPVYSIHCLFLITSRKLTAILHRSERYLCEDRMSKCTNALYFYLPQITE